MSKKIQDSEAYKTITVLAMFAGLTMFWLGAETLRPGSGYLLVGASLIYAAVKAA